MTVLCCHCHGCSSPAEGEADEEGKEGEEEEGEEWDSAAAAKRGSVRAAIVAARRTNRSINWRRAAEKSLAHFSCADWDAEEASRMAAPSRDSRAARERMSADTAR